jgi:hypothetical protein
MTANDRGTHPSRAAQVKLTAVTASRAART